MTKEAIYRLLARLYKWDPNQIAALTPAQQLGMLGSDEDQRDTITFATNEELQEYLQKRGNGK